MEETEEIQPTEDTAALIGTVERILTEVYGGPIALGVPESLRDKYRNRVLRCPVVSGPEGVPASVIAKASVGEGEETYDPEKDTSGSPAWRFFNEWSSNLFLNALSVAIPLNARLLGGDRAAGMFLLEDLGSGASLADVIQGDDAAAAESALFSYARALGRMHAETLGQGDAWRKARRSVGGTEGEREPEGANWLKENVAPFRELCAELEIPLASGFEEDVEAVRRTLDAPGPFEAFSPNDTCPDNHRLMPDGSLRFFDFEWAGYRHTLLDAAYLRVPFPTCWCVNRLPEGLPDRLEAAYRVELARSCPAAQEDARFYEAMSHACAYWTITTLSWGLKASLEKDGDWGIATVRQRHLYRLETFPETAARHGHLPALTETFRTLAAKLASLWLPDLLPIPIYPPFRPAAEA